MMNWLIVVPELILALCIGLVLLVDFFLRGKQRLWLILLAVVGILATMTAAWLVPAGTFGQAFVCDGLSQSIKALILIALLLVTLFSWEVEKQLARPLGEYLVLLLSSALGMLVLASGTEMVVIYVGLELTTFPVVLLTGYQPANPKSAEGGLKYLILAALGSAILLFGFSLIYAATGAMQLTALAGALNHIHHTPILVMGLLCVLAGLGFKMGLVPFHMWAPDAYEGAPTPITAFLSVASKTAGFIITIRILAGGMLAMQSTWAGVLAVLAAATMFLGNFAAIPQTNLKRLLAYSSIAQAGYLIMGLVAFETLGLSSLLYYLFAYLMTNLAAFAVVIAVERASGSVELPAYYGLAERSPRLALVMLLALLSLAGIPPLAGFTAKFYLFAAVYGAGYVWLVIVAVINSALSLYYYLRVVRAIYIQKADTDGVTQPATPLPLTAVLIITVTGILVLGIYPNPVVQLARLIVAPLIP